MFYVGGPGSSHDHTAWSPNSWWIHVPIHTHIYSSPLPGTKPRVALSNTGCDPNTHLEMLPRKPGMVNELNPGHIWLSALFPGARLVPYTHLEMSVTLRLGAQPSLATSPLPPHRSLTRSIT